MSGKKGLTLGLIILSVFLLEGCSKKKEVVVAQLPGKKIFASEFEEKLKQLPAYFQQNEMQQRKLLESLVDRELLISEAKRRGLVKAQAVKERLELALEQILIEELVKKAIPEVTLTEEELKNYYEEKKPQFVEQEKVKVSQILVRSEAEAAEILKQLKKGEDFEGLARAKSISPDANRGGDIGYFGRGEMLPEFEKIAFALNLGEVSPVVKSPFGYHLIKLTDKKEKRQKTFDEAREELVAILRQKKQREGLDNWFKALKAKTKVKISEEYFAQKFGKEKGEEEQKEVEEE